MAYISGLDLRDVGYNLLLYHDCFLPAEYMNLEMFYVTLHFII